MTELGSFHNELKFHTWSELTNTPGTATVLVSNLTGLFFQAISIPFRIKFRLFIYLLIFFSLKLPHRRNVFFLLYAIYNVVTFIILLILLLLFIVLLTLVSYILLLKKFILLK